DLSFPAGGHIVAAPAKVGDTVVVGQLLAAVDTSQLNAQLANAQATRDSQQAKLDGLVAGARPEDIAVAQSQLDKAQQDLDNELSSVRDVLATAYADTVDAVRTQTLSLFVSNATDVYPPGFNLSFTCSSGACQQATTQLIAARVDADVALDTWKSELDGFAAGSVPDTSSAETALDDARGYIQTAHDLMASLSTMVTGGNVSATADQLATYRAGIDTGTTEVNTALSAVNSQRQTIASQEIVVEQYTSALALKKAGSSPQDIASQRAVVAASQAQVDQIKAQIAQSSIRSPIAGVVTRQDAKVGQSATANVALVSVISTGQLEIDANVPEVDIGRVMTGDHVDFTVDALPGESFTASVSFVDPAQTVIEGVVDYQVKMMLSQPDPRLKSGLTANLDIRTAHKDGVLLLPQYAIIQNDQGTFVNKVTGTTMTQVPVVLGILSKDGTVEIISGVQEGDRVQNIGLKQ
ncbi:MAG TPA: efflux RND transporter periplasmic adaptor subunit, partial [Candidatus Paceibacterota bacterium]|nr:efflux RND transporter periplasmic adaptor subunit [Candidatus Paceibacterota bacterium]